MSATANTVEPLAGVMSDFEKTGTPGRRSKVVRLIDEYDLDGVGDQLERRWTAPGDDRMSLRVLADYFNRELLRSVMAEAGLQPLDGEVENTYRLLTDEGVTQADRTRAERRLEREGVDVETLRSDFVSYQAIRTYLKEYRDASYAADTRDRRTAERETAQRLRGRVLTVTDDGLDRLRRNGDIDLGEHRVFVEINVLCEDCGSQYGIEELLDRGGCDCGESGSTS